MDATERKMKILNMFQAQREVKISHIVSELHISRETARRDLAELQNQDKVKLVRGGAIIKANKNETAYEKRLNFMEKEKDEIAEAFCKYVKEEDTIYLDFGTTSLAVARKLHRFNKLTVVTNSLPIINELYKDDHISLLMLGGMVRKNEGSFVGEIAKHALGSLNINIGFFSGSGFDLKLGLSNFNFAETELSRTILKQCLCVVVGVDHTKLDQVYSQKVANINEIDILISDEISSKTLIKLRKEIPEVVVKKVVKKVGN